MRPLIVIKNTIVFIGFVVFYLYTFLPTSSAAEVICPMPNPGETSVELCKEGQTEIPRGSCLEICIRGKLENESISLSIDQSIGQGFSFNQDNGPSTIETTESRIVICSDSTSCGSASITMNVNGISTEIGSVRSDSGRWVFIESLSECPISGSPTVRVQNWSSYYDDLIVGKQKIYEDKSTLYRCSKYINSTCKCELCYKQLTCIDYPECPDGFHRPSKDNPCCQRISYSGTAQIITIYCTKMGTGPVLYEWGCQ